MSENKDKEPQANLLKAILSIFLPRSKELQNLFTSIDILIKSFSKSHWVKEIDWQKVIEDFKREIRILDDIKKQLKERNINLDIMDSLDMEQSIELYKHSRTMGLTFADMVEDNLELYNDIEYSKALKYLDIVDKRHKQIINNKLKPIALEDNLLEALNNIEDAIAYFIKKSLVKYDNGNVTLNDEEKEVLKHLKQHGNLKNKELAQILGYEIRGIESICSRIRKKFSIDFLDDSLIKRRLLISLAKHLKMD